MHTDHDRQLDPIPHSPIKAPLIWLGGSDESELGERHERATYAVAGVLVVAGAALSWLAATAAVAPSTRWALPVVLAVTLPGGVLVGAVSRAIAAAPARGWQSLVGRIVIALAVGVAVAELASLAVFAGSIDRRLGQLALRDAESAPAVTLASAELSRARQALTASDNSVGRARTRRDDALTVARCEQHPTPTCPQSQITGIPGFGSETRTAKEVLVEAQQELRNAAVDRDGDSHSLDNSIVAAERALTAARQTATATAAADHGLGARWAAMNDYSRNHHATLVLRLAMIVGFALLTLLPGLVRMWRGESTGDRHAAARAEVDRAELRAATAAAIRHAELRAEAETLWAEQQLVSARLAVQAQTEIDAAHQRRRVAETLGEPVVVAAAELPVADHLPAQLEPVGGGPAIPDIARTAARWVRPLVPSVIARAIDTTIHPVRTLHQVFEEVEEITFTIKRTRRVNVGSLTATEQQPESTNRVHAQRLGSGPVFVDDSPAALTGNGPAEVRCDDGLRALPPG